VPLRVGELRQSLRQARADFFCVCVVQRVVAAHFTAARTHFVPSASQQGAAQVQAAVHRDSHQPSAQVVLGHAFTPDRDQTVLHRIGGEVIATQNAPRCLPHPVEVRAHATIEVDLVYRTLRLARGTTARRTRRWNGVLEHVSIRNKRHQSKRLTARSTRATAPRPSRP